MVLEVDHNKETNLSFHLYEANERINNLQYEIAQVKLNRGINFNTRISRIVDNANVQFQKIIEQLLKEVKEWKTKHQDTLLQVTNA
jgi:hypothetical protein